MPQSVPPAIECVLVRTPSGSGLTFSGELRSPSAISGTFRLSVKSAGANGQSATNQSGTFSAEPGKIVRLGSGSVSAGPQDRVEASLQVNLGDQTVHCPLADRGLEP